jgi:hypothetical protein
VPRELKDPLRELSAEEYKQLKKLSRSGIEPAEHVARAKALLAVAEGCNYTEAARRSGRRSNDAVSRLVSRFNREGLSALLRRAGQGRKATYTPRQRQAIVAQARRKPDPKKDGTATWSLSTLQKALRRKKAFSQISTQTIGAVLHDAGFRWVSNRSWCETGRVQRRRKSGVVTVVDPDAEAKKKSHRARVSRRRTARSGGMDTR